MVMPSNAPVQARKRYEGESRRKETRGMRGALVDGRIRELLNEAVDGDQNRHTTGMGWSGGDGTDGPCWDYWNCWDARWIQ